MINQKKKAFTLIELMIVIAIIGILAALLLPKIGSSTNEARNTGVITNANSVFSVCQSSVTKAYSGTALTKTQLTTNLDRLNLLNPIVKGGSNYVIVSNGAAFPSPVVNGCVYVVITVGTDTDIREIVVKKFNAYGEEILPSVKTAQ